MNKSFHYIYYICIGVIFLDRIRKLLEIDYLNSKGYSGKGIGIAVVDTGIYLHDDLKHSIVCFKDFVNNYKNIYDDNGHGTHVAGITSGNGKKSNGLYRGVSPGSKIIALKCLDKNGNGKVKNVLNGYKFIIENMNKYNIRIVNISVGSVDNPKDFENELLISKTEELWKKGLVVVAAAGNNGPQNYTVTAPGCARNIITVGASDDKSRKYSGRGPTKKCIIKPEIVCPGTGVMSCNNKNSYQRRSGTSMSAPIISGIIALMLEKNPNLKNKDIKKILHDTCRDLGLEKNQQGWGEIDIIKIFEYI